MLLMPMIPYVAASGVGTLIPRTDGTVIGNMTSNGGLAASFDGNTSQNQASSSYLNNVASGNVGKDWGAATTHTVLSAKVYASTNGGFNNDFGTDLIMDLQGSTDNFSASIVLLGSATVANPYAANNAIQTITATNVSTAYRYHRVYFHRVAGNVWPTCAELEFYA